MNTDDLLLKERFQECTLPDLEFSHEAHIRMGWIYIKNFGIQKTLYLFPEDLQRYVKYQGGIDKYHHTLTVAALKTIYHFYLKNPGINSKEFVKLHPRLITSFKNLIHSHYLMTTIESDRARHEFVEPDLVPYDC